MKRFVLIVSMFFWIGFSSTAFAQTYEEKRQEILDRQLNTRAEINVLDARIKSYQDRIRVTENRYEELYRQFENLNSLIALQDDKIGSLETEQGQIQEEIKLTEAEIELRDKELTQLIENYKDILLYTYKNGRTTNLELIVTSRSINQMLIRSYYLQKLEEQKEKQADQIRVRQIELVEITEDLEQIHERNELILDEIRDEKGELNNQQVQQRGNIEKIRAESATLAIELNRTRQEQENLETNFAALIEEEDELRKLENERLQALAAARNIADAARRAEEVAKYSTPIVTSFVSDETLAAYEQTFAASKGGLDWPVNSTTVSKKFGVTRNPLTGTQTPHPGITIVADANSEVRAIADGYVFNIVPMNGYGNVVFVSHGSYRTAYGNLSQINVQKNSILKAGQIIGLSGTQSSELGESLFFMVRKNSTNLNPEEWLR
ncbi:MAG: peptidoglycan DD-metalloendopeptidase family protein [Balneolales bacterium]|nr:peptidoglycan DD-metalloendopeptidase family protein [Balneolales bacterium]